MVITKNEIKKIKTVMYDSNNHTLGISNKYNADYKFGFRVIPQAFT